MECSVCKKPIKEDEVAIHEQQHVVHEGVCHSYLQQSLLTESQQLTEVELIL